MCQRYVLPDQAAAEREFLPDNAWWQYAPRFNVAPGEFVPAIRLHQGQSEGVMLRWGLIPAWFEGKLKGPPKFCVESARLERSKTHATPWRDGRRCILPVAGFYTWQLTRDNYRQPFFVRLTDRPVVGIAAVWDRWVSDDDDVIESCSLICVAPNELMARIAGERRGMPAILRRKHYHTWLHGSPAAAGAALLSYRAESMQAHPVSPRVNSAAADDPGLIRAAG